MNENKIYAVYSPSANMWLSEYSKPTDDEELTGLFDLEESALLMFVANKRKLAESEDWSIVSGEEIQPSVQPSALRSPPNKDWHKAYNVDDRTRKWVGEVLTDYPDVSVVYLIAGYRKWRTEWEIRRLEEWLTDDATLSEISSTRVCASQKTLIGEIIAESRKIMESEKEAA